MGQDTPALPITRDSTEAHRRARNGSSTTPSVLEKEAQMDPITLAFASAVAAGAAQGMAGGPTAAAYQRLRDAILSRFGNDSTVVEAIEGVEVEPTSGAIEFLRQSLQGVAADQVPDLLSLAASLLELVGQRDVAGQHAVGRNIAQADRWSSAAVNINAKDQDH